MATNTLQATAPGKMGVLMIPSTDLCCVVCHVFCPRQKLLKNIKGPPDKKHICIFNGNNKA